MATIVIFNMVQSARPDISNITQDLSSENPRPYGVHTASPWPHMSFGSLNFVMSKSKWIIPMHLKPVPPWLLPISANKTNTHPLAHPLSLGVEQIPLCPLLLRSDQSSYVDCLLSVPFKTYFYHLPCHQLNPSYQLLLLGQLPWCLIGSHSFLLPHLLLASNFFHSWWPEWLFLMLDISPFCSEGINYCSL